MAKNGLLKLPDWEMEYICFGSGAKALVMLPGLGDGLRTMKGTALPMSLLYREFAKDYKVYAFSRRSQIPAGYTTRDMAKDQKRAMDALGIAKADILGVSMGGMIAQWLVVDYPETVDKLVLVVTAEKSNALMEEALSLWMQQAKAGDHTALMDSNLHKIYSEHYYRQNKWMVPLIGKLTKPKNYERFLVQADACLTHNTEAVLSSILAETLVIGGEKDMVLGAEPSKEIAEKIPCAELKIYPQWGHGVYEEEKTFNAAVLEFLTRSSTTKNSEN